MPADPTAPDPTAPDADTPVVAPTAAWSAFAHLSATKVQRYRRILGAFADARQSYVVHLRPADIARALGEPESETLTQELDQLAEWGNLRPSPDTTRVTSVEEFTRRRMLYALTRTGEAVEAGLATYARALARRAELQTVALEDIRTGLAALIDLTAAAAAPGGQVDVARAAATLRDLETVFVSLADNAAAFMSSLTRSIDTAADGEDGFLAYKQQLIDYLQRFIGDLVVASGQIAGQLATLEELDIAPTLQAVARRRAEDSLPDAVTGETTDSVTAHLDQLDHQWEGLRRWFVGSADTPSQAGLLRARARAAIPDLLETVQTLSERQSGRSDRMADHLTLARWFAEAPDDHTRHRLWRAAFGLHAARHLDVDTQTLEARTEADVPATTPWAQSPPVHVSARLRRTTRYDKRGPARISDRTEERRALSHRLAAERVELHAARRLLATGRPIRLSELELDRDAFPLLLALLGDALVAAPPGGPVETTSSDGTMSVRLEPTGDGRLAHITTPDGTLIGHDHLLTVTDLLQASTAVAGGGDGRT